MDSSYGDPSAMFQGPSLWWKPSLPNSMENCQDDSCCGLIPHVSSTLASVLHLSELDIVSMHKIFEDLPEIADDALICDEIGNKVLAVSSSINPSTPPAQASKPSAMSLPSPPSEATLLQEVLPVDVFARPFPKDLQFTCEAQQSPAAEVQCTGGLQPAGRVRGGPGKVPPLTEARLSSAKSPVTHALEAIPIFEVLPLQASADCGIPKALPSNVTAQDLSAVQRKGGHSRGLVRQRDVQPKRVKRELGCTMRTKMTRHFDKAEHICRERWRRDDMAGKFSTLESLLPPGLKRDRSTIVEDSMKLVKNLQHRKVEILKRRSELERAVASAAQSPRVKLKKPILQFGSPAIKHCQANETGSPFSSSMDLPSLTDHKGHLPCREGTELFEHRESMTVPKEFRDCVERFYIHSELVNENIVIEMTCHIMPNFQSSLFKALEGFGLEVTCCRLTKIIHRLICNISVKPYPHSARLRRSSTSIMEALKSAFGVLF